MCNSILVGVCDAHPGVRLPLSNGFPAMALLERDRDPSLRATLEAGTVGCKTVSLPAIRSTNLHL